MLGQWSPLARCFILLTRLTEVARSIALESRGSHVSQIIPLVLHHDAIISVYVRISGSWLAHQQRRERDQLVSFESITF